MTGREHEGGSGALIMLFLDLNVGYIGDKSVKIHQSSHSYHAHFLCRYIILVKRKPQAQNGVTCAKAYDSKPRFNT